MEYGKDQRKTSSEFDGEELDDHKEQNQQRAEKHSHQVKAWKLKVCVPVY